ncbi:hypothetical protein HDV05_000126 [Chytridiales sp. JEL 0842]|nr:hypothetical protein HDV05_000126 [Chytridiales sp. JEL 0842]
MSPATSTTTSAAMRLTSALLYISACIALLPALVSATITFPNGLMIRNYDFPGLHSEYKLTGQIMPAVFVSGVPCQLDLTNKTEPGGFLFVSAREAYKNGCGKYAELFLKNGFYKFCDPSDLECQKKQFQAVIVAQPATSDFCCSNDPFMARFWAQFNLIADGGRFQDANAVITGISPADAQALVPLMQARQPATISSDYATDQGTALLNSPFVKAYSVIRIVITSITIVFEITTSAHVIAKEGFAFNLKWGLLATLSIWTVGLLAEYIMFSTYALKVGFPYSAIDTQITVGIHWSSFTVGYMAFSFMLLSWARIVKAINIKENVIIRFMRNYFPYVTWFSIAVVAAAVTYFMVLLITRSPQILIATSIVGIVIAGNLLIQVVGYSYYAFRILSHTRAKHGSSTAGSSVRNDMNTKLTMLAIAVIVGWILLIFCLVLQNYIFGIASHGGFWTYGLCSDVCFWFIFLMTFASLNIRFKGKNGSSHGASSLNNDSTLASQNASTNGVQSGAQRMSSKKSDMSMSSGKSLINYMQTPPISGPGESKSYMELSLPSAHMAHYASHGGIVTPPAQAANVSPSGATGYFPG